jgi:hypothetical protein
VSVPRHPRRRRHARHMIWTYIKPYLLALLTSEIFSLHLPTTSSPLSRGTQSTSRTRDRMCGWQRGSRRMRQTRLTVYENIRPFEFRELRSACALQPRLAAALIELRSSCALEYQILGGIELRLAGALRIPHMKSSFLSLSKFGFSAQNLLSPLSPTGTMPYIIPHVRNLEDSAPRMLIGHRLLPEMHPLRRFEEQKRLVYDRDYAYMCLVGIIPPKEQGGRRPERRLPPAPLPPGSRASKFLRKLLPSDPPASGPPSPRSPGTIFRDLEPCIWTHTSSSSQSYSRVHQQHYNDSSFQ